MSLKYYHRLSLEEKQKTRKLIENLKALRKEQRELISKEILQPIQDSIFDCDSVTRYNTDIDLVTFYKRQLSMTKRMEALFGDRKDEGGKNETIT